MPGAKLFFPEEHPDLIAEEARRLWGVEAQVAAASIAFMWLTMASRESRAPS